MFALVAEIVEVNELGYGRGFEHVDSEEIVALFTSRQLAEDYERRARLAQRQRRSFASDRVYRQNSLLARAESARVEEYEEPNYPVDPSV